MENNPFGFAHMTSVDPDIGSSCLSPGRERELMRVGPKVPDAIEAGRRSMGNNGGIRIVEALPGRAVGIELEPRRAKLQVVWLGGPPNSVDSMSHPLEDATACEPE